MNTINDIIDFVSGWLESKGYTVDEPLTDEQITEFVGELQEEILNMDVSLPKGTTIIGYSGFSNGNPAWKIVKQITESAGDGAIYITDLPAGQLINDAEFQKALSNLLDDKDIINKITSGYENNIRINGGSCGYGDYLSLDDFISAKLMGENIGISENIIIFTPDDVDPSKVFARLK